MRPNRLAQLVIKSISLLPPILLITLVFVYSGLFLYQQYELIIRGTYMIIPIIVLNIIYFMKLKNVKRDLGYSIRRLIMKPKVFLMIAALFAISQILGIVSSVLTGRSIIYFISNVIGILIIAIQIMTTGYEKKGNTIIILEIICLYLNIVFCQTLELPLYFGTTDPLIHMRIIQSIIDNHAITSSMGDYETVPLHHILGVSAVLLNGLDLKTSFYIYYSIAFANTILIMYLFAFRLTNNNQIALTTTLLYALNAEILFAGLAVTTRVMSFSLVLQLLYLLINKPNSIKRALSLGIILPLILTHHTTLIQFWVLLVIMMFIERVIQGKLAIFRFEYITLFIICFLGYWIYVSDFVFVKLIRGFVNISELSTLPDSTSIIKPLTDSFFGAIDQSIVAFFALLGVSFVANTRKRGFILVIIVFSFISLLFYLDTPFEYLAYLLLTGRLPLLVVPFVMISMAFGVHYFLSDKIVNIACCTMILTVFGISSILIQGSDTDLNLSPIISQKNRQYFINSEIAAFDHIYYYRRDDIRGNVVFSDWQASRYLQAHFVQNATPIITWPLFADSGYYFLFRIKEITEKKQIKFTMLPSGSTRTIGVLETKNDMEKWFSPTSTDVIYNSGTCLLQYIND